MVGLGIACGCANRTSGNEASSATTTEQPGQSNQALCAFDSSALSTELRAIVPATPAAICARGMFRLEADIVYSQSHGLLLDLYVPSDANAPVPTVIWIHGGGWTSGSKANVAQARGLVCEGFAVAAIDYRLSGEAAFPAQVLDVREAIRFLRTNAASLGLDPARFVAFGSSSGGHLASLAGVLGDLPSFLDEAPENDASSAVQAVVDWYGPTNFALMDEELLAQGCAPGSATHGLVGSPESRLVGCPVAAQSCREALSEASPLTYAAAPGPPFLIVHGTEDCTVPGAQSTEFFDALTGAGVCAVPRELVGAAHGGPEWTTEEPLREVVDFLAQALPEPDPSL